MGIMWPRCRFRPSSSLAPHPQRHITPNATEEVKLEGYRAIGVRTSRESILYSRNHKHFNKRFLQIAKALADLPADSVIDGEVVALDESGRPDFHASQHFQAEASRIRYFVFDLLILNGRDLTNLPLSERRNALADIKLQRSWIRMSEQFNISAADMLSAVRQKQLEGVVAKRKDSLYEAKKKRERRANQSPDNVNKKRFTRHEVVAKISSQMNRKKGIEECRYEQRKSLRSHQLFSYLCCWTALALALASRKFLREHIVPSKTQKPQPSPIRSSLYLIRPQRRPSSRPPGAFSGS